MRSFLIISFFLLPVFSGYTQDNNELFNRIFDEIFITPDNAEDLEEIYQQLYHFYQHPFNLNKASAEDLKSLFFLQDNQIKEIIEYRELNGDLLSVYELQSLHSFSVHELKLLEPFITVDAKLEGRESNDFILLRYERDLQLRKGYKPVSENQQQPAYLGTPDKVLMRMKGSIGTNISYGWMAEKDAGENLIFDPSTKRYGMDHYSGFIIYQGSGKVEKFIIGDYQLQFGQGLMYSSGFSLGKSAGDVGGFRRISTGIRPHSSSLESGFLRGAAVTIRHRSFRITGFASANRADASLNEEENYFASINHSGYHRTMSETGKKDNLEEKQAGLVAMYKRSGITAGLGVSAISYSAKWQPAQRLYNINAFAGDQLNTVFGFINYAWRNINIFAESAYLQNGGLGGVGGSIINLSSSIQTGFIARHYEPAFISLYGNAIGEKSNSSNEKGVMWLMNWDILHNIQFSFYFDRFSFPWLSYQISSPSDGYEYLFRLKYKLSKKSYMMMQYKEEEKGMDVKNDHFSTVVDDRKRNYQFVVHFPVNDQITLRSRVQGSNTTYSNGAGVAFLQDLIYENVNFKLTLRYALFNTDDFKNRQYVYENDLLYAFNFPALQGQGRRFYALFKYNLTKKIKLWARYSHIAYTDRNEISSGNEMVEGNRLSEVKLQVLYKL